MPTVTAAKPSAPPIAREITSLGFYSLPIRGKGKKDSFLIDGMVDNQVAVFNIDTGWSHTAFDVRVILHITPIFLNTNVLFDPILGRLNGRGEIAVTRVQLGRAVFTNVPAQLVGLVMGPFHQITQHGMLGADFLHREHSMILFGERRLLFAGSQLEEGNRDRIDETLLTAGYRAVEMKLSSLCYTVMATIGKNEIVMLVDTGADASIIDDDFRRPCGLIVGNRRTEFFGVRGRRITTRNSTVPFLRFDDQIFPKTSIQVGDLDKWDSDQSTNRVPGSVVPPKRIGGVLGRDFLTKHSAIIDFHHAKLWLWGAR